MRTITIMILIWTCLGLKGQTVLDPGKYQSTGATCVLSYTDNKWVIEHNDTAKHQCQAISIVSLPPMSQTNTPVNLFITAMGTYSLKKASELVIPDEYTVVVEDLLTGQYYNLKSQEPYTFKMNRGFGQTRFVLEISKSGSKVASTGH